MTTGNPTHEPAEPGEPVTAVEVYWRPGCVFCVALRRALRHAGLPVREHNIWTSPTAAARVRAATGGDETVPTVFVGTQALVNPSRAQVERALARHAPHLLASRQPPTRRRWWPRSGRAR